MRGIVALTLSLALACAAMPADAQQVKPGETARDADRSGMAARTVTGTVKKATDGGFVVVGREAGQKDKEWAFALDAGTRIDAGGKTKAVTDLREGDPVTVTYTNRDGKIVAQSVKVNTR